MPTCRTHFIALSGVLLIWIVEKEIRCETRLVLHKTKIKLGKVSTQQLAKAKPQERTDGRSF
jgi:hypothetical protein